MTLDNRGQCLDYITHMNEVPGLFPISVDQRRTRHVDFFKKIGYHVRISILALSGTINIEQTQTDCLHIVYSVVCSAEIFSRYLACSVWRHGLQGVVLVYRKRVRIAIDCAGRGVQEPVHATSDTRSQNV